MTVDVKNEGNIPVAADSKLFVGHFVRRQGQLGTVAVIGHLGTGRVEIIQNPKRLFPRDGLVEIHGLGNWADLSIGDWVEFDVVKNTRFRAPNFKALHLSRLPRFAVLPTSTMPVYRDLFTREGWSGDTRPGLWAFRLAGDTVIVAELEVCKNGRLKLTRNSARDVKCYSYADDYVARVTNGVRLDDVFIPPKGSEIASLDWSDEVDHIARVVNSLAITSDPRVVEIISWLERHHEVVTSGVSAPSDGKEPALDPLRSAALASRLRSDRSLLEVYLSAALHDETVRDVVAGYAKEGYGAERDRLREQLHREIIAEKRKLLDDLTSEIDAERARCIARIDQELKEYEAAGRSAWAAQLSDIERAASIRVQAIEASAIDRRDQLDVEIVELKRTLEDIKAEVVVAEAECEFRRIEAEVARAELTETRKEIDRSIAIAARLEVTHHTKLNSQSAPSTAGIRRVFPSHPRVSVAVKGELIARQVMLSEKGRELLQSLLVMLLAGELPILVGSEVADLLRVAESIVGPGRCVSIEADPTLISIEDLWARPGSGAPTMLAAAAEAARDGGAILVVVRGVERSGARFWLPALSEALRSGGLARGLFVCCTVHDLKHEEVSALPRDIPWLHVENIFKPGAALAGPSLLTPPRTELEALDPGPMPVDLSEATEVLLEVGEDLSLELAMRTARMFMEASLLLGDKELAQRLVLNVVKQAGLKPSQ